jgi:hypothetical protein
MATVDVKPGAVVLEHRPGSDCGSGL